MNNLYLKIDHIVGECKDAAHQGWIDAHAYSWGRAEGLMAVTEEK